MSEFSTTRRRTALDAQFDRIRAREEAGLAKSRGGSRAFNKFLNNRLAVIGLIIFSVIILASIFAPLLTPYDPNKINLRDMLQSPSWEHWFGTDRTGRDLFSRVLYGGRISILVGLGSAVLAAILGVLIGVYTGYVGGWLDALAMRISEIFMSFPQIILVLMLVSILGQSLFNLMLIFTLTGWGGIYRMARARMLSIREEEYVLALQELRAQPAAHRLQAHAAQRARADHGQHHALDRGLHPAGSGAELPRPRRAALHPHLGQYPQRGAGHPRAADQLVDLAAGRHGDLAVRPQRQFHRRRAARCHRPEPAGVMR